MRERLPEELVILETEFSEQFVEYMKNRMIISFHRYGFVKDAMVSKEDDGPKKVINAIDSALLRITKYQATGNTEWLVDASNLLMMEFMFPQHPNAHFRATDSGESPGRIESSSGESVPYSNRDLL